MDRNTSFLAVFFLVFVHLWAPHARSQGPCPDPIILVHGTATMGGENWSWGYQPALAELGCDVTIFDMPCRSLGDIRRSTEVLAGIVAAVLERTGAPKIDLIGHSQGGLEPRVFLAGSWEVGGVRVAGTDLVDDYIALAAPNHGTLVANAAVDTGICRTAACWQMRHDLSPQSRGSALLAALNEVDETPGRVAYTSLHSATDELVQPVGTAELSGACDGGREGCDESAPVANVLLQDLCPGRPVDHVQIAADALAFELVKDALAHEGPADPLRLPRLPGSDLPLVCLEPFYEEGGFDRFPEGSPFAPLDILFTASNTPMYETEPADCVECEEPPVCPGFGS